MSKVSQQRPAVWISNGRLVSHTLGEKQVLRRIQDLAEEQRKHPETLKQRYIKMGMLSKSGHKLTKAYGG